MKVNQVSLNLGKLCHPGTQYSFYANNKFKQTQRPLFFRQSTYSIVRSLCARIVIYRYRFVAAKHSKLLYTDIVYSSPTRTFVGNRLLLYKKETK